MPPKIIRLPAPYRPYPYQKRVWEAHFIDGKKRLVSVWHRRAGKDFNYLDLMIAASQERVGLCIYFFPYLNQARRNLWDAIDEDGNTFLSHFNPALVHKYNEATMSVKMKNGSIITMGAANQYDAYRGSNPIFVVFSEFAEQHPACWDTLRPVLAKNGGTACFNYTPKGKNHGFDLYQMASNNDDWHAELLTVDDTFDWNGNSIMTPDQIEAERDGGMSEEMIQQEFYCSFTASTRGAYFAESIRRAVEQDRIDDFIIDPNIAVNTFWDLGFSDSTAIWFIQYHHTKEISAVYYYENSGHELQHYVNVVNDIRDKLGIVYGSHYAPHDGQHKNFLTGQTVVEKGRHLGINFEVVPRIPKKQEAIEMARSVFPRVKFHKTNCDMGLRCLREYHSEYKEKHGVFSDRPVHNWASHGTDAFLTFAQQFMGSGQYALNRSQHAKNGIMENRVNTRPIF